MTTLLLFAVATIGLTNILVQGEILNKIGLRPWAEKNFHPDVFATFQCFECCGFWSGLIMSLALVSHNISIVLACAFAGSVMSSFYDDIRNLIISKTDWIVDDKK